MIAPVKQYIAQRGSLAPFDPPLCSTEVAVVLASDYDQLEKECERLRVFNASLESESRRLFADYTAADEETVILARERDALRGQLEAMRATINEARAMFPFKIDKQAFVVNGGEPIRADGDDEFYSASKVNDLLGDIRCKLDAALQAKPDHIPDTTKMVSADT